jgi:predicted GNAT family acetyltransferase
MLMPETHVADRPETSRYVIEVDGESVGVLQYRLEKDRITLTHAEVDPASERQGLGSALTAFALDDARARGLAVFPRCSFVRAYVQRHREYVDLVPESAREQFGL